MKGQVPLRHIEHGLIPAEGALVLGDDAPVLPDLDLLGVSPWPPPEKWLFAKFGGMGCWEGCREVAPG